MNFSLKSCLYSKLVHNSHLTNGTALKVQGSHPRSGVAAAGVLFQTHSRRLKTVDDLCKPVITLGILLSSFICKTLEITHVCLRYEEESAPILAKCRV